ncbi:MAG: hypothetical protein P8X69_13285, partial [Maritimibacter sp.]
AASADKPVTFHFFVVENWQGEPTNIGDEHTQIRWVTLDDAIQMQGLTFSAYIDLVETLMARPTSSRKKQRCRASLRCLTQTALSTRISKPQQCAAPLRSGQVNKAPGFRIILFSPAPIRRTLPPLPRLALGLVSR